MTKKRYSHDGVVIIDHLKKDLIYIEGKEDLLELVEYVDKLQEESRQLKQFKEDVFNKIDMHLRMLPTVRDNEFNNDGDPSLYTGAIYILETLKKGVERMTECNAIIEANNKIDKLKRENKKLNELCVEYGFEVGRLEEKIERLKEEIKELKTDNKAKDDAIDGLQEMMAHYNLEDLE